MSTLIRPEISKRRSEWISKHRYYELKHFCLQYPEWKKKIFEKSYLKGNSVIKSVDKQLEFLDPVHDFVADLDILQRNIEIVEASCEASDAELYGYLLEAVTKGVTWDYLRYVKGMPCGRSKFYKAYRKVFWNLDKLKN